MRSDPVTDDRKRRRTRLIGRPRLEDAGLVDERIREAAIRILLEKGEAATIVDVAAAAGLTRKTVYARYTSKAGMLDDAVRDLLRRSLVVTVPTNGTTQERLSAFLASVMQAAASPECRAVERIVTLNPSFMESLLDEVRATIRRQFVEPLTDFLAEAGAKSALRVENPDAIARAILSVVLDQERARRSYYGVEAGILSRDKAVEFTTGLFMNGLIP